MVELLRSRHASGSLPRQRTDGARLAVVIEGGSSRAAYGGGMVCELERRGLLDAVDAVYGSSAGSLNGAWLVCRRANANVHGWWTPEVMDAVISPRRLLERRSLVNTDHLIDHVYDVVTPMGFEEILASQVEYHPLATDTATGDSVDLAHFVDDVPTLRDALRASTRLPVIGGPPVEIAGRHFIDAGISENVPVHTALAQGATHVLALRTQPPRPDLPPPSRLEQRVVHSWMVRRAPGAVTAWASRHARTLEEEHLLATSPHVLQVAPPLGSPSIHLTSRATKTLRRAVGIGQAALDTALGEHRDIAS